MFGRSRYFNKIWFCVMICTGCFFALPATAALDAQNFNALYRAASNRNVDVIARAMSRGLNIDTVNVNGDTGLCVAIRNNDMNAYTVFRHFGANPNHSCILNIPRYQYSAFMASAPAYETEYTSASARYARLPVQNQSAPYRNNFYSSQWLKSPITWTIGGLALIAGGIAIAGSGGGGGGKKSAAAYYASQNKPKPNPDDDNLELPDLSGVPGDPEIVKENIKKNVVDSEDTDQSSLWGVYLEDNGNIANTADIEITADDDSYNKNHWGGIYSKNGYIYNSGDITITSDNSYAAGLMACIVASENPENTACYVNPDNTIVGDIYNEGNITIRANKSAGIFSSDIQRITNKGNISLTGQDNTGIFVYGNADEIINDGTIELSGSGSSEFLAGSMSGIWASGTADITNNGDIIITSSEFDATGMYNKEGVITNNGNVTLNGSGSALKTTNGSLINNEKINISNISGSNAAYGMKVDNQGSATNSGDIMINGFGYGMFVNSGTAVNEETGTITLSQTRSGYAMAGNGSVTNKGKIKSSAGGMTGNNLVNEGSIESGMNAMNTNGSAVNNGNIFSETTGMYGQASGNLTNSGTIDAKNGTYTAEGTTVNSGTIKADILAIGSIKGNITNSGTITSSGTAISTSQGVITNEQGGTISSSGSTGISVDTQTITTDDKENVYAINLTVNNQGKIEMTNGGTAILAIGDDKNQGTFNVNNSGEIIVSNKNNSSGIAGIVSSSSKTTANITSSGSIVLNNNASNSTDTTITGIDVAKGNVEITKDGSLTINNTYFTPDTDGNPRDKHVIGVKINEGTAINNGTITINSNNAIGMLAEYDGTDEVKDDDIKVHVINNGTIEMNGSNNIAMYANKKGSVITNAGTIIIKNPNLTEVHIKHHDTVYEETDSCNSFICLGEGGTYINSGTVISYGAINFNDINGKTLLSTGSKISAEKLSGKVYANYDLVTGSFQDVYTTDYDSLEGNVDDLTVVSASPIFAASLQTQEKSNDSDENEPQKSAIKLTRRSFYNFTTNNSAAQYLESNYRAGNNLALYDNLKASDSSASLTRKINSELGLKLFPNFSKQVLDSLRVINSDINKSILSNNDDKEIRAQFGINAHYRKQDETSEQNGFTDKLQSVFGIVDKKYNSNWRAGLGLNYAVSNADYDDNNERKNNMLQFFAPFIYNNSLYQFISTPRVGFLGGKYKRYVEGESRRGNTKDYYYGITNELHRDIALEKFILEPNAEFNVAGLYSSKIKDSGGLMIDSHNDISAEIGIGLYLKKIFNFAHQNSLSVRAGGSTYLELLNPYRQLHGSLAGMNGYYKLNKTKYSRNRSVLRTGVQYHQNQINLIGELNKYIEDTDGYEVNLQMKYDL